MTFRGTVINGVIVPDSGRSLPEGTRVELSPLSVARRRAGRADPAAPVPSGSRAKVRRAKPRSDRSPAALSLSALAGLWKGRADWKGKSSVEVVAELRKRSRGPRRG